MNLNEAKQEIARLTGIAEGWRAIGNALMSIAFDIEYRDDPPADHKGVLPPPIEMLRDLGYDAEIVQKDGAVSCVIQPGRAQVDIVTAARAALLGQPYRMASDDGSHHEACSYPLCPNRSAPVATAEVTWSQPDKLTTKVRVCEGTHDPGKAADECLRWAQWIASRVASGSVKLVP